MPPKNLANLFRLSGNYLPIFTPPARRAWRSYKFASLDFSGFFSMSKVGLPLMGDTAVTKLREPIGTRRLTAEYVNKTCILTYILHYLNRKKVLRANILMQNVL